MLIDQDPVYIPIKPGIVDFMREYAGGDAIASYNIRGRLLGVELLAPVSPSVMDAIMESDGNAEDSISPDVVDLGSIAR
jgi:hypothetical protein